MRSLSIDTACKPWIVSGSRIAVGLSGGRDSVALLRVLLLCEGVRVCACHVHHGIRGAEADADAAFCENLCREHGVEYELCRVDVPTLAAACGESLETVARRERRRLLVEFAGRHNCRAIALAHHEDDQAETILFHLSRGGAGLRCMRAVSEQEGVIWLRPLLSARRHEITAWLESINQTWREDATNGEPDVTRNALRLEVIPALCRAMKRDVSPIICRSASLYAESVEAMQEMLPELPVFDPQGRLYLPYLMKKGAAFRKVVVHHYLRMFNVPGITEKHVLAVCALFDSDSTVCVHNLPGGLRARRAHKRLWVEKEC